jgi:hypothetical protein
MTPYALVLHSRVMVAVSAMRRRDRDAVLGIFKDLENDPFQAGHYTDQTPQDRTLQVKKFGIWMVKYWADHAVNELRVVEVIKVQHLP